MIVDVPGFIADLKNHAIEHGFHVHDERHFIETYTMRQAFEIDLHPESACGGPVDLQLSLDLEPRTLMAFEDEIVMLADDAYPSDDLTLDLLFTWQLPPLAYGPDLLVLATDLAGISGTELPTPAQPNSLQLSRRTQLTKTIISNTSYKLSPFKSPACSMHG